MRLKYYERIRIIFVKPFALGAKNATRVHPLSRHRLISVCGTTGKRKACKDCSCGLAEELQNEKVEKQKDTANAKSSCGSVRFTIFPKL